MTESNDPRYLGIDSLASQLSLKTRALIANDHPIRVIHHFACTGGTLFSRCLAALPNVLLLSEVDPTSPQLLRAGSRFTPTDLVALTYNASRSVDQALLGDIFRSGLRALKNGCDSRGFRLVLRDHCHGHYCFGDAPKSLPNLSVTLAGKFDFRSIVTVRHPLDSLLSLINNDWLHFQPRTCHEYARRYLMFLDDHTGADVIRYEDFVDAPAIVMQQICRELDMEYSESFETLFAAISLSGDSGRTGNAIASRPRREVPDWLRAQLRERGRFQELCERLGYEADVEES